MQDKLPPKILLVEYDEILSTTLSNDLERNWFDVCKASDLENALKLCTLEKPNAAIVSSKLKDISSLEIVTQIRKLPNNSRLPIVFLLNSGESTRNYASVDNGLIEFVFRPSTPNQIITAIKSLLRRSQPVFQDKVLFHKDLSIDLATYKVVRNGKSVHVGPTEFKILHLLMKSPRNIYSRTDIIDHVWGFGKEIEHRTVDVHINRLRSIIRDTEHNMNFIKTVRAGGYCLSLPGEID